MRSSWTTVDPKSNDQGPYKRLKSRKQPQRHREEGHVQTRGGDTFASQGHQAVPGASRSWERGRKQTLPQSLQKDPVLRTP